MSLKYAILGFLTLHPMSGYDLKTQYFDGSVANFWPADQAQIYRTLERLKADGWVESGLEVQTDRPNRKPYHLTEIGRAALVAWLEEGRGISAERRPFLVQLYFARLLSKAQLLRLLNQRLGMHQAQLAQYQALELPQFDDPEMQRQLQFGGFTLDYGLRYAQMQIEWLEATIVFVESDQFIE